MLSFSNGTERKGQLEMSGRTTACANRSWNPNPDGKGGLDDVYNHQDRGENRDHRSPKAAVALNDGVGKPAPSLTQILQTWEDFCNANPLSTL